MCCRSVAFTLFVSFLIKPFEDSLAEALLKLEEELDPGKVHAEILCQVPYPEDSAEIVFGEEADVRLCP